MNKFKPVDYLNGIERKQAIEYERLLSNANNLKDVRRYENLLKRYVKLAYMRMKMDEEMNGLDKEPEEEKKYALEY
ncbi:hypothetical protein [Sporosarcina sp. FSL K6-5500]|uniref:hypothetical protein n=1 Tax=Sporosarcina sp. FSL K6-5500 TaxID=2921558 RepID=UPI0030F69DBC